jgi:ribosomal protein S18 acetylase RimI-like enzyme
MPEPTAPEFDLASVRIAPASEDDQAALWDLFRESMLEGQVRGNDTGADLENLRDAYFHDEGGSAFWIARLGDDVIGMAGVQRTSENSAEIRRLRVRKQFRRCGVGTRLMEQALAFCQRHVYLKIVLDVRIERGPAIALFEKFGFRHCRTRDIDGRKMLDFLLDLYTEPGA